MRVRSLAVIAASILLIGAAAVMYLKGGIPHLLGLDRPPPGESPIAIGTAWDCPSGYAVKAYATGGLIYYPATYPKPPAYEDRPVRCFRTNAEAASQGYRLAAPPPGAIVYQGVYLVPSQPSVHDECVRIGRAKGLLFPCPLMVPSLETDEICSGGQGCSPGDGIQYALELTTPAEFPGASVNKAELGSLSGATGTVLIFVSAQSAASAEGPGMPVCRSTGAGPTVMGVQSAWASCTNYGATSIDLKWQIESTAYVLASPESATTAVRAVAELVASHLAPLG
jgi:hypothetical protein